MSVVELYGKCKELGYCDCAGFFGCKDPDHVGGRLSPADLDLARKAVTAEAKGEGHRKYDANEPLVAMVECTVCDRSHVPSHPHITKVDGDEPLDHEPSPAPSNEPTGPRPIGRADLPDWLKEKPGAHAIQLATASNAAEDPQLCQVCGDPWAPKHACKGAEPPETDFNRPKSVTPYHMRQIAKCDVCGKKKQSNHKCKGQPTTVVAKPIVKCEHCTAAGELCVRHGGVWSGYDTARGQDERIATELPLPVAITQPATQPAPQLELDRELAAIATILAALDGLGPYEVQRAFAYVADRKGIRKE